MGLTQAYERNNYYFGEFQRVTIERRPDGKFRAFINGVLLMRGGPWETEKEAYTKATYYLERDIKSAFELELKKHTIKE